MCMIWEISPVFSGRDRLTECDMEMEDTPVWHAVHVQQRRCHCLKKSCSEIPSWGTVLYHTRVHTGWLHPPCCTRSRLKLHMGV